MQLPAMGYGLRYEYGIFRQTIEDGWQREQPDNWLRRPDPWEVARPQEQVEVKLGCSFELRGGSLRAIAGRPSSLIGMPFDRPVVGYGGKTINTLRLWAAAAPDVLRLPGVQPRRVRRRAGRAARGRIADARALSGRLDEHGPGAALRAGVFPGRLLARRSRAALPPEQRRLERASRQGRDPAQRHASGLAVPELMRILLDEAQLGWDEAWDLTQRTLAYTNHTLLPEALEKWPLAWFELLLPRHLEIIHEINRRLLEDGADPLPGRRRPRRAREPRSRRARERKVRMANLAIVGSHSTNGVAAIHSELLRTTTVKDLAEMFPERFNNKTNGVTPRRWLLLANPALAGCITEAIGDGWITDLAQLAKLEPLADDTGFRDAVRNAKREAKARFADWLKIDVRRQRSIPTSIFDCQVKRIHEYKRQLLNALRIVVLYNRLRQNPDLEMAPRTFFFAGKAAPAYHLAKLIIKFINNLAGTIDGDPAVRGRLKVVFLPEYCVSLAERLIPASDVSNQISTAGYEASGTSNMKFMMNGALTIGTRDGATIEMAEEAGEENFFLFGLTAEQVAEQPRLVQPAVALRQRAGNARGARSDLLRPLQPQRAGRLRAACATTLLTQRRPLHAPGRSGVVSRRRPAAARAVRRSRRLGAQGHPERGQLRQVLQRPHDRRVRGRDLGREAVPGAIACSMFAMVRPRSVLEDALAEYIPLHEFDFAGDFRTALPHYVREDARILVHDPLDAEDRRQLVVFFDGLDELAMEAKAGQEAASEFRDRLDRQIDKINRDAGRLEIVLGGREVVVQANEPRLQAPGADPARSALLRAKPRKWDAS